MNRRISFTLLFSVIAIAGLFWLAQKTLANPAEVTNSTQAATTYTISGAITHLGVPVADVVVSTPGISMTTGVDGLYTLSGIPSGSDIYLYVLPPAASGLAERLWIKYGLTADTVLDFDLVSGFRLHGMVFSPDGNPVYDKNLMATLIGDFLPTDEEVPLFFNTDGSFDAVLQPGFYAIYSLREEIKNEFAPPTILDLRTASIEGYELHLLNRPVPVPTDPPVASLISVSPPDIEGYATVTGAAGSVPGNAAVMVLNQDAAHVDFTVSAADGSFTAGLFAPPGSSLLVKYDIHGEVTRYLQIKCFNEADREGGYQGESLPGASLYVGGVAEGEEEWKSFASAGHSGWWVGWWVTGTLQTSPGHGFIVLPGETITVTGTAVFTSPDYSCSGTPAETISAGTGLLPCFAHTGRPLPEVAWFSSFVFTPTGLPIQNEAESPSEGLNSPIFTAPTCRSAHAIQSDFQGVFTLPADLEEGIYLPVIALNTSLPQSENVPALLTWFHEAIFTELPPLRVGDAAPPHIPWQMFADYPSNGIRGVLAQEEAGKYDLPTRARTHSNPYILPRVDTKTGQPIHYRLEPGSFWVAAGERRLPRPPWPLLKLPGGQLTVEITPPEGSTVTLGPAPLLQSSTRTPAWPDGNDFQVGTGHMTDIFHLSTMDDAFNYAFEQYGLHTIVLSGEVEDIYGNHYQISGTYEVLIAQLLDIDPAQLPTTPYEVGDAFAAGVHIYPPMPAEVRVSLTHLPNSDPDLAQNYLATGQANPFGYYHPGPGPGFHFEAPGEFRVDINAHYEALDGTLYAGALTWGNVVETPSARFSLHGRRGMDYKGPVLYPDNLPWFINANLPSYLVGIENYYPYFSGDILWGSQVANPTGGDSLHTILTIQDKTGPAEEIYNILRHYFDRVSSSVRWPPEDGSITGQEARMDIGEAPLFFATTEGQDARMYPDTIELFSYWYGSSERPDVHVRELVSTDGMGTAYWRYDDTYADQPGEPADGDQPNDIKWNFGGAVLRVITDTHPVNEYAIYGSFWVLLPDDDPVGAGVTPPFQGAAGGTNGGPIMTLLGEDIDMLFLPKGVRPGDVLFVGDPVSFSGHVGPPMDSRVDVTITSPGGAPHTRSLRANKVGWVYDPSFDFVADQPGRWTVDVLVEHDRVYPPTGNIPTSNNTGTVLGSGGRYEFYVMEPSSAPVNLFAPLPGWIEWPDFQLEPVVIQGRAPFQTSAIYYTIYDKGMVLAQGSVTPDALGYFSLSYDVETLHDDFPNLALVAHEGRWDGLSDEVSIRLLAIGNGPPRVAAVTLIGEEVFVISGPTEDYHPIYMPLVFRKP